MFVCIKVLLWYLCQHSGIVLTLYGNNTQSWSTIEMRRGGFVLARNEAATRIQLRQGERNLLYSMSLKDQKMFVRQCNGTKIPSEFVTGEQNCTGKGALTISSMFYISYCTYRTHSQHHYCLIQNKHHHLIHLHPFNTKPVPESVPC